MRIQEEMMCIWPNATGAVFRLGEALDSFKLNRTPHSYHFKVVVDYSKGPMVWIYHKAPQELPLSIREQVELGNTDTAYEKGLLDPIGTIHLVGNTVELKVDPKYGAQYTDIRLVLESYVGTTYSCVVPFMQ